MQSLDYKLVTARHDAQYFPSSLSSFSPTTSRVCRTVNCWWYNPKVYQKQPFEACGQARDERRTLIF